MLTNAGGCMPELTPCCRQATLTTRLTGCRSFAGNGRCSAFRWSTRNDNTPPDIDQSNNEVLWGSRFGGRLLIEQQRRSDKLH
ncbi:hypothetical protein JTE90_020530 [Oedothorax gibbosus]|uniref:Uncharacterized protein n=1 Tax=Oedothorax gibbosus TaxID=931172 RepID=A0AAV6VWS5_9ARAC|nr:hypothetical protein JTE90_020530 [Oedothorax gibbosus]